MPPSSRSIGSRSDLPMLSCQACTQRKVRCNKQAPCSTCENAGIVCIPVQRKRLPRGRLLDAQAAENRDLRERLANLEALVAANTAASSSPSYSTAKSSSVSSNTAPSEVSYPLHTPAYPETIPSRPPPRFLADGFWESLADKEPQFRELLSDESSASDESPLHGGGSALGFGSGQSAQTYINAALALRPSAIVSKKMCRVYLERVDPLIRIFHRPSLIGFLMEDKPYLDYPESHPALDALRASVFLMAVVSMAEDQCSPLFGADRPTLIATYRSACEVALERVSLPNTEDIAVLQSFVLYLFALKSYDRTRTAWTLFSVAYRIATALRINQDRHNSRRSFFDQQMRSRLWYTICLLDAHLSFDRVSTPLISPHMAQPAMPLNIDDSDFDATTKASPRERVGITDMCLALRLYHTQRIGKQFGILGEDAQNGTKEPEDLCMRRQQLLTEFEKTVNFLHQGCDAETSTYAWIMHRGAEATLTAMSLHTQRPMNWKGDLGKNMSEANPETLKLAVKVLHEELVMQSDPRGEPYRWYGITHWQPLAIAIFESYGCSDKSILREVWPTIEEAFEHLRPILAQYRQGTLWEPMKRLMRKTRQRVNGVLTENSKMTEEAQPEVSTDAAVSQASCEEIMPAVEDLGWGSWDQFITDFTLDGSQDWLQDADFTMECG